MSRPRGRPRQFVEAEVKDIILQTFWLHGYAATSLDQLSAATGLSRPSLSGAFGSKADMYLQSMEVFGLRLRGAFARAANPALSLVEALKGLYSDILDVYLDASCSEGLGCFLFGNAVVEAPSNPELRAVLQAKFTMIDALWRRVVQAHAPDASDHDLDLAANLAAATLHSIAIRARTGFCRADLDRVASGSIEAIARSLGTPSPEATVQQRP